MKLQNLNAIITGGSLGLGKAIADHFLLEGANVLICARNEKELQAAREELAEKFPSRKVIASPCDVSDESQVNSLFADALRVFGQIDALVLNAGIYGPLGATESVDLAKWRRAIDINLFGVLLSSRAAIPHFKANGKGKIVVISVPKKSEPLFLRKTGSGKKKAPPRWNLVLNWPSILPAARAMASQANSSAPNGIPGGRCMNISTN